MLLWYLKIFREVSAGEKITNYVGSFLTLSRFGLHTVEESMFSDFKKLIGL